MISRRSVVLAVLVVCVLVAAPAWSMTTTLTGLLGSFTLNATANQVGSLWNYDYALTFDSTLQSPSPTVHIFSVDNPFLSAYTGATNTDGFTNPPDGSLGGIQWSNGNMHLGDTVTFHYSSIFAPSAVSVSALAVNSGTFSSGVTIGMSNSTAVPECDTLVLAGLGNLMMASGFYFRRSRRK